jgi:hypothetical protein
MTTYTIRITIDVDDFTKLGDISLEFDGFNLNQTVQRLIRAEWGRLTSLAPDRAIGEHGDDPGTTRAAGEAC